MSHLLQRIFGGRPMTLLVERPGFWDTVAKRPVRYWRDHKGRTWMAFGAWSLFRVRVKS